MVENSHTIREVIARDMCVGCGACAIATGSKISVSIGRYGSYQADLSSASDQTIRTASRVCPFSDDAKSETELSNSLFPGALPDDDLLGKALSVTAGRVSDDHYLGSSSSGGMTSWVASQLLIRGKVDGIIHVGPRQTSHSNDPLFSYGISRTPAEFLETRKSMYYSTTLADVMSGIRGDGLRYAVIGVPCFISAARRVVEQDTILKAQLTYFLGLVCGHLKSAWFAESAAWQVGVKPETLAEVDFRIKNDDRPANDYGFAARGFDDNELTSTDTKNIVGGNWGHGMFQMNACNYCDDIFAETADIAFGDAWLPEYQANSRGTNVIINRNSDIQEILDSGVESGDLHLDQLDPARAGASQAGNVRHRRVGLAVRLADDQKAGLSIPQKRVVPSIEGVSSQRLRIIRFRRRMTAESFAAYLEAREKGDLSIFTRRMKLMMVHYRAIDNANLFRRLAVKVRTQLIRLAKSK